MSLWTVGWCIVVGYLIWLAKKQYKIIRDLEEVFSDAEQVMNFSEDSEDGEYVVVNRDDFCRLQRRIFQYHEER